MESQTVKLVRVMKLLVAAGVVAWCGFSWWNVRQVRRAGALLIDRLNTVWPESGTPEPGTRETLIAAAEKLSDGRLQPLVAALKPARPLGKDGQTAVQRLFATPEFQGHQEQFIAIQEAAQRLEASGTNVGAVRRALAQALAAAAAGDAGTVAEQIELAQAVLDEVETGGPLGSGRSDAEAAQAMVTRIGPAFHLGRELMTEGHAAVEKLVGRASRHFRSGEIHQAAYVLDLAAALLGIKGPPPEPVMPSWFDELAETPSTPITESAARAAVELCQAMAASEQPAEPVVAVVSKAQRELDVGRFDGAFWWASVALNSLGMSDQAIHAAVHENSTDAAQ